MLFAQLRRLDTNLQGWVDCFLQALIVRSLLTTSVKDPATPKGIWMCKKSMPWVVLLSEDCNNNAPVMCDRGIVVYILC